MKRGTIIHHKTADLAGRLKIDRWGAVGILESMWHATAAYCPAGDLGRCSDAQIAFHIGWTGDAAALVAALVESGWLDANQEHRLIVHHWAHHADDTVHAALARAGRHFADGTRPSLTKVDKNDRARIEAVLVAKEVAAESGARRAPAADNGGQRPPALALATAIALPEPCPALPSGGSSGEDGGGGGQTVREALVAAGVSGTDLRDLVDAPGLTAARVSAVARAVCADKGVKKPPVVIAHRLYAECGLAREPPRGGRSEAIADPLARQIRKLQIAKGPA